MYKKFLSAILVGLLILFTLIYLNQQKEIKNLKTKKYIPDSLTTYSIKQKDSLYKELKKYKEFIKQLNQSKRCYYVTVTMYNAVEEQTDNTPFLTADNTNFENQIVDTLFYVAISRDLHAKYGGPFNFEDIILLLNAGNKNGIYIIKDIMNRRYKRKIDILENSCSKPYIYRNAFIISLDKIENYKEYVEVFNMRKNNKIMGKGIKNESEKM